MSIRVLLSSKHNVVSEGIAAVLRTHSDMDVVGVSDNNAQTNALCDTVEPDVVLIGMDARDDENLALVHQMSQHRPSPSMVAFSGGVTAIRSLKFWMQVRQVMCQPPAASMN